MLSVVIATKGRPDLLEDTLGSLSRCDALPAELIVVDGDEERTASPVVDRFREALDGSRIAVSYVASEPGLARQRNIGIDRASGEVIVFADDDVSFDPGVFAALARAYDDPLVVGATGKVIEERIRRVGDTRSRLRRFLPGGGREGSLTRFGYPRRVQRVDEPQDVEYMLGSLMSARRTHAERLRFDERLTGYALAEDEDFSYRLSRLGRIRYVPDAVIEHHATGARASATREFNRTVVVHRAYLFRKNFVQTPLARLQFGMLVGVLICHRALNREWAGVRGLLEGSIEAWRSPR